MDRQKIYNYALQLLSTRSILIQLIQPLVCQADFSKNPNDYRWNYFYDCAMIVLESVL